jgi:hypothetical protein
MSPPTVGPSRHFAAAQQPRELQALERQSWNHAEIDRRDRVRMVAEERPPTLRWRPSAPDHVFGDRRLGDLESELQQFTIAGRPTMGSPFSSAG